MKTIHKIKITSILAIAGMGAGAAFATVMATGMAATTAASVNEGLAAEVNAEELWRSDCASCHGRDGKGQTRIGRRVGVEDLTDGPHQKTFSDQRAFISLKLGLEEDGKEHMKPFGKGFSEDNGLTDEEILALVEYTRQFGPDKWTEELNKEALEADRDKEELKKLIEEHGPEAWK